MTVKGAGSLARAFFLTKLFVFPLARRCFLGGLFADGGNYWFNGGGEVYVREVPIDVHVSTAYFVTGSMTLHLCEPNNVIPNLHVSSTVICETTNVLSATSKLALGSPGSANTGGTFDLNGYDQDVCATKPYNTTVSEATTGSGTVKSAAPAVLRITGLAASDTYIPWKFTGQASFEHAASGTFRLLRAVSDSTGSLTVSDGRVELLHGAAWSNATAVNVTGGTLFVSDESAACAFGPAAGASKAAMMIADGGTLELAAGGMASVKSLSVDGNSLSAGYYGSKTCTDVRVPPANRLDCITGGGVLYNRGIGGLLLLVR